jgi:hypothetical protein
MARILCSFPIQATSINFAGAYLFIHRRNNSDGIQTTAAIHFSPMRSHRGLMVVINHLIPHLLHPTSAYL